MQKLCIHAGHLIDGVDGKAKDNMMVSIEEGKIITIEPFEKAPEGVTFLDLSNQYVMPGMINCHVHVMSPVGISEEIENKLNTIEKVVYGEKNLLEYLNSGVTTIRSLGSEKNYDLELKKAVNKGLIMGPHMICSGQVITMTGGHGHSNGLESDGVDECRKNTRRLLKSGSEVIKIMATGGVMTEGVEPGSAQLTWEEMKACVEEAHKADRLTATHAQGTQGIKNALKAGIDSIEHGIFLDEECITTMLAQKSYLVPTLAAPRCILDAGKEKGMKDYVLRKANLVVDAHIESFKNAYHAGVKIAMGTDAGTPFNYHHNSVFELELMVKHGMSCEDALVVATRNGAECLGLLKQTGTLEVGKWADFITFEENPYENISALRNIKVVFKEGIQVKG